MDNKPVFCNGTWYSNKDMFDKGIASPSLCIGKLHPDGCDCNVCQEESDDFDKQMKQLEEATKEMCVATQIGDVDTMVTHASHSFAQVGVSTEEMTIGTRISQIAELCGLNIYDVTPEQRKTLGRATLHQDIS